MAFNTNGMSDDELAQHYQNQNTNDLAFRQFISTPQGMQAYNNKVNQNWYDIQNGLNGYTKESGFDSFMGKLTSGIVDNIPAIYGAMLTGGAMGLFGDAAGAAAGGSGALAGGMSSAAGDVGLGSLGLDSGALSSLGWMDGMGGAAAAGSGAAAGLGAGEAAGGLGAIANAGTVTIGAPAAAAGGGMGLGGAAAAGAGAAGLGAMTAPDGSPIQGPMQTVNVGPPPASTGGLPDVATGSAGSLLGAGDLGNIGIGALPYLSSLTQSNNNPTASTGVKPSIPGLGGAGSGGGLGGLLNGLGSLYGAYNDTQNNAADTQFYKDQLDKMTGMYAPGTPEATLMEQQMNAKDAAAGRNSQYGTRATNLAGMLAQQRANIMMSPAYTHTADMYRNKGDQNANPWLNALGQATQGGGGLGSLFGALGSGYNYLSNTGLGQSIGNGLGNLFGSGSGSLGGAPSMGTGAIDNTLF